jgi:chromosome segregation ATPase
MSQLIINKLVLLGTRYKRTLHFDTGLTIIRGDRTSGKSLVLSLIDYCLGKSKSIPLKVQKELAEYCDQVFLEIRIEEEVFTLNRFLKQKQSKLSIYFCEFGDIEGYTPKNIDIREAMQIIMGKLNINEYKRIKYKSHSTEQELETISFRDIFRYVYIQQHSLGTDNFLDNKVTFKKNKNPYAFEMIFNLVESDKDQLNEQLVNAKNMIEARKREISGLTSYLEDKEANDFASLLSKVDKIQKEISIQRKQKEVILNKHRSGLHSENDLYIKLKDRLTEIANQIYDYEKQKNDLNMSISSKRFLLKEYEKEKSETDVTLEINYRLVMKDQKIECPLCHSAVNSHIHQENNPNQKVLINIQRDIKNKMKLVKDLIEQDLNQMDEIDSKIISLKKEQEILNNAIGEFTKKTSVPYLSQIDSINSIINSHDKKKEIVDECIRIHRKIDEKNNLIEDLNAQIARLEEDLKNLKVSEGRKTEIFGYLNG